MTKAVYTEISLECISFYLIRSPATSAASALSANASRDSARVKSLDTSTCSDSGNEFWFVCAIFFMGIQQAFERVSLRLRGARLLPLPRRQADGEAVQDAGRFWKLPHSSVQVSHKKWNKIIVFNYFFVSNPVAPTPEESSCRWPIPSRVSTRSKRRKRTTRRKMRRSKYPFFKTSFLLCFERGKNKFHQNFAMTTPAM